MSRPVLMAMTPAQQEQWREMAAYKAELEALPSELDGLRLRRVMHERTGTDFLPPRRYFNGWMLDSRQPSEVDDLRGGTRLVGDTRVLLSWARMEGEDAAWIHASISHPDRMPTYDELTAMHAASFPGFAYQVFASAEAHVNFHAHALHLWGRMDGLPAMPEFSRGGGMV